MSRTARLGAFILSGLTLFGVAVLLIGDRQYLFERTYRLKAPFETVVGLDDGAVVRLGGVRVGTVEQIHAPRRPGDKVTVVMKLSHDTRDVLRRDSVASVETEGLLGNKYVAISAGSRESPPLRDGDTIGSRRPVDHHDLVKKASDVLAGVDAALAEVRSITAKVDRGEGTAGALVNDRKMADDLRAATAEARRAVAEARAGVAAFHEAMQGLRQIPLLGRLVNRRGFPDAAELTRHEVTELPRAVPLQRFAYPSRDLFGTDAAARLKRGHALDRVGTFLEGTPFTLAVVTATTAPHGDRDKNLELSRARAAVVREYLVTKFAVDDRRIKTRGLGEDPPPDAAEPGRIEIVVYAAGR